MIDTKDIQPTDFVSIYKDIAEEIGIKQKAERGEEVNLRKTALQYGYTERWLRQMINDEKTKRNGDKL